MRRWLAKLTSWWAARSVLVGAAATVLDVVIGLISLQLGASTRVSAMIGVTIGATFAFFANRFFAFKDTSAKVAAPAVRFIVMTVVQIVIHGQVVKWLRDDIGVPYVASKVLSDLAVFTASQLVLLRYLVFPKAKTPPENGELEPR